MTDEPSTGLAATALRMAALIAGLDNGGRAELRRLDAELGSPVFWRIAAQCELGGDLTGWARLAKIIAILDKGRDGRVLHNPASHLGRVLFENGISEIRFNRLCAAAHPQRVDQIERIARGLDVGAGINLTALAFLVLTEGQSSIRGLCRDYFSAQIAHAKKEIA